MPEDIPPHGNWIPKDRNTNHYELLKRRKEKLFEEEEEKLFEEEEEKKDYKKKIKGN